MGKQIDMFEQMRDRLHNDEQNIQTHSFRILATKIDLAGTELDRLMKDRSPQHGYLDFGKKRLSKREKLRYAMKKTKLDKAISEVETWQRLTFDPLFFELVKAQTKQFDVVLEQSQDEKIVSAAISARNPLKHLTSINVFLPPQKLLSAQTTKIAYSSVELIKIDSKWRLLDIVPDLDKGVIRELAVRLKGADPATFGLLTCLGAVHHQPHDKFSIVFRIPDTASSPETLRAKMMKGGIHHSLSDRFRLATQLARAVFHIHTFDMVHKSIRPENIILFRDSESALGSAFLLGFEKVRRGEDGTALRGDTQWEKNLYRHPQRQGDKIEHRYIMQHDIYSLGVCLLEIGLWTPFVEYTPAERPTGSQLYNFQSTGYDEIIQSPETVKSRLLDLAIVELPGKMGTKYAAVVESCLTCLDLGNDDFGDESELREEGVSVAVRYIEKVRDLKKTLHN